MEKVTCKTIVSLPSNKKKLQDIQKGPWMSTQVINPINKDFRTVESESKGTYNLKDHKILSNNPSTLPWEQYFHTKYASPPSDKYQPTISTRTDIHWHNDIHHFNFKDYFGTHNISRTIMH
eukprot:1117502-Ditylum_brightwellii.AAC.1